MRHLDDIVSVFELNLLMREDGVIEAVMKRTDQSSVSPDMAPNFVHYFGWGARSPEDCLLLFLENTHLLENNIYISSSIDEAIYDGQPLKRLAFCEQAKPMETSPDVCTPETMAKAIKYAKRDDVLVFTRT